MALVSIHPDVLGSFMTTGLGLPDLPPPPPNTCKIENPCESIVYREGKPFTAYVVVGEDAVIGMYSRPETALLERNKNDAARRIFGCPMNGVPVELGVEPCEWAVLANRQEVGRVHSSDGFVEFARRFNKNLNNERSELSFYIGGSRVFDNEVAEQKPTHAEIWDSYTDHNEHLQTRRLYSLHLSETDWRYVVRSN